ncbi:phosphoglycerate mutase-like protein [Glonium stellatum]|uniref:Phosphoglycerate mutase-like protein n=1 Tax=Glonium stellatum TaxID=574774 RepID=A0A8E2F6L4_9PEZI|nr:phosphoglycerate mutase-like protein [Glonium stellatum]
MSPMSPTLILIRHAQALHNVDKDYDIPDPLLSELGINQCQELKENLERLPLAKEVGLIVVSPMRRTIQTAMLSLPWLIERGVPVLLDAGWQENSDKPCDTGSPLPDLSTAFPTLDFRPVDPLYPNKTDPAGANPYRFDKRAVLARGQACLRALHSRPEKVIAVVSHSGFLRCAVSGTRYANADYRVFEFEEGPEGAGERRLWLREWKETEETGGGMGRSERGRADVEEKDFPREEDEIPKGEEGEVLRVEEEVVQEAPV